MGRRGRAGCTARTVWRLPLWDRRIGSPRTRRRQALRRCRAAFSAKARYHWRKRCAAGAAHALVLLFFFFFAFCCAAGEERKQHDMAARGTAGSSLARCGFLARHGSPGSASSERSVCVPLAFVASGSGSFCRVALAPPLQRLTLVLGYAWALRDLIRWFYILLALTRCVFAVFNGICRLRHASQRHERLNILGQLFAWHGVLRAARAHFACLRHSGLFALRALRCCAFLLRLSPSLFMSMTYKRVAPC